MSVEIKEVTTKKEIKQFVTLPFEIFKDSEMWVPPLIVDEMETFDKNKNPAFESADGKMFMAFKNGKAVGRIMGINSRSANKKYDSRNLRFGWIDCFEDYEVAEALYRAVENWGKELGMETMTGPHGFSDLDPEGLLIEGFDRLPTIANYYHLPYYLDFAEKYGFEKEIDYLEFRSEVPLETGIPPKLARLGERIKERSNVRVVKFKNRREMMGRAQEVFHLLDETFEEIYGSVPLTEKQINYYVKKYISYVDKDLIQLAVNENDVPVGFMIAMPSLSEALQKARGRLLPVGIFHILKAMRNYDTLDFYLAGVKKEYRGHGVDLLMVLEVLKVALDKGVRWAESNQELETNKKIHAQWKYFNPVQHKRRRIFRKDIK